MENLSILFAIDAEEMFNNGDFSSTIDLCLRGKEQYPDYPIGYVILAKAYSEIYDYENAQLIIAEAKAKFPINRLINSLSENFKNQPKVDNGLETEIELETDVADNTIESEATGIENAIELKETAEIDLDEIESKADQDNFLRLVVAYDSGDINANSLKSANPALIPGLNYTPLRARSRRSKERSDKHIPLFPDFSMHFGDDLIQYRNYYSNSNDMEYDEADESVDNSPMIVSDTYASILVAQGAYSEALGTYKELCQRNPDKADFYNQKIEELQMMI